MAPKVTAKAPDIPATLYQTFAILCSELTQVNQPLSVLAVTVDLDFHLELYSVYVYTHCVQKTAGIDSPVISMSPRLLCPVTDECSEGI
jgi:hypothetical protein